MRSHDVPSTILRSSQGKPHRRPAQIPGWGFNLASGSGRSSSTCKRVRGKGEATTACDSSPGPLTEEPPWSDHYRGGSLPLALCDSDWVAVVPEVLGSTSQWWLREPPSGAPEFLLKRPISVPCSRPSGWSLRAAPAVCVTQAGSPGQFQRARRKGGGKFGQGPISYAAGKVPP